MKINNSNTRAFGSDCILKNNNNAITLYSFDKIKPKIKSDIHSRITIYKTDA